MVFRCPRGKRKFMKNRTAPRRELNFRGSGGSKIDQTSIRKQHPAGTGPQERLGRLPGTILGAFWSHFGSPNRCGKGSEKQVDILSDFERFQATCSGGGQRGRRQGGWARGRGFRGVYLG